MSRTQVTFRSVKSSATIENHINKHLNNIYETYNKVNQCKVVISSQQKAKPKGKLFSIHIRITIPGHELFCKKENRNLYVAIWEGFNCMDKLLNKHTKRKAYSYDHLLNHLIDVNSTQNDNVNMYEKA